MRTATRIFIRDLKRILANPVAVVVAAGVCLIPSVYAWLNVLANWNPYENTGTVPVAVAIEDRGASVPGLGEVNAGDMIRERLEENHQLGWEFVDEGDALAGVDSGRFYAAFVIPPDFTSSLADVLDGDPERAHVGYYVNEKANAVAPKVTDTGATTLETQISDEFASVVGETVAERVVGATDAAVRGADETRETAEERLRSAGDSLTSLADRLDAAGADVAGARSTLASARASLEGAATSASGLATSVDAALGTLSDARGQARDLARDLSSALAEGEGAVSGLSSTASNDIGQLAGDVGWAQGKVDAALAQLRAANGTAQGLVSSLEAARDAIAGLEVTDPAARELQAQVVANLGQVSAALEELADAQLADINDLQAVSGEIAAGADSVSGLAGSVNDAVQTGAGALGDLRAQVADGASPQLTAALDELAAVGGRVSGGVGALGPMIGQADGTLGQLDALLAQCSETLGGTGSSVRETAGRVGSLADDLAALQGAGEAGAVADLLALDPSETGSALGSPVDMVTKAVYPVETYGSGVAPFYANLALWVGGFVLVAVYKLEVDPSGLGGEPTPTQAFLGRWMLFALFGQVQALVCCAGLVALGIGCVSPAAFVLAGMVESLVYVLVVYALAVAFRHVGKALGVLLVVLQIPGASGLYPIQMQPAFFRAISPWLPFTYGIGAMREAVGGFYDGRYAHDLLALLAFALPALVVGVSVRRALVGVNALFDREMGETDLLVTERVGTTRESRLAVVLDAIATSPEHREQFLARAARLELAYPRLVRRGLVGLACVPVALLLVALVSTSAFVPLVLWVVALVSGCGYLIGLEYVHERVRERARLQGMGRDELLALVEAERGGDAR